MSSNSESSRNYDQRKEIVTYTYRGTSHYIDIFISDVFKRRYLHNYKIIYNNVRDTTTTMIEFERNMRYGDHTKIYYRTNPVFIQTIKDIFEHLYDRHRSAVWAFDGSSQMVNITTIPKEYEEYPGSYVITLYRNDVVTPHDDDAVTLYREIEKYRYYDDYDEYDDDDDNDDIIYETISFDVKVVVLEEVGRSSPESLTREELINLIRYWRDLLIRDWGMST